MKKTAAKRYNPRIGDLTINFLDWFAAQEQTIEEGQESWSIDEALEYYSIDKKLSPNDTYQIAVYLGKQRYPIKAEEFYPETILSDKQSDPLTTDLSQYSGGSVFDKYFSAIKGSRYEEAHQIYNSMSPSEKQVIIDQSRRKQSMSKTKTKTAQQIPADSVGKNPIKDHNTHPEDLLESIETVIDQADDLEIPPQLSLPLAITFDHYRAGKAELIALKNAFRKVIDFMKQKGIAIENAEVLLQKYSMKIKDLLKIADEADKRGDFKLADSVVSLIKIAQTPSSSSNREQELTQAILNELKALKTRTLRDLDDVLKGRTKGNISELRDHLDYIENQERSIREKFSVPNPSVANEAVKLINPTNLVDQFRNKLLTDHFEEAKKIYERLTPEDKAKADEISRQYHTAMSLQKLCKVGKTLSNQSRHKEANTINKIVKAQMMMLPEDMQEQIILVLVPNDMAGQNLPQGFKDQQGINDKMKDMTQRLQMLPEEEVVCNECAECNGGDMLPTPVIAKLLSIADKLDEKGLNTAASQVDAWMKKTATFIKESVHKAICPDCKAEFFYYAGHPQSHCINCRKQHEMDHANARPAAVVPPKSEWEFTSRKTPKAHAGTEPTLQQTANDKYVSEEGHFKGKEGSGERWDNCVKHFVNQGKSKESAEKLCGYIKSRKG